MTLLDAVSMIVWAGYKDANASPTERGEWKTLPEIGPPAPMFLFSLQVRHATEMGVRDRGLDDRRSSDDLSRTAGIV